MQSITNLISFSNNCIFTCRGRKRQRQIRSKKAKYGFLFYYFPQVTLFKRGIFRQPRLYFITARGIVREPVIVFDNSGIMYKCRTSRQLNVAKTGLFIAYIFLLQKRVTRHRRTYVAWFVPNIQMSPEANPGPRSYKYGASVEGVDEVRVNHTRTCVHVYMLLCV